MLINLKKKILKRFLRNIESYEITVDDLKQKQLQGAIIVDVRSEQEYKEGHIEGAINIPDYEINSNIADALSNKEKEIILYCQSGSRSKKAYKKLKKFGYQKVYSLYGGLENF